MITNIDITIIIIQLPCKEWNEEHSSIPIQFMKAELEFKYLINKTVWLSSWM